MKCPKCGGKNPDDYIFCQECGAALTQAVVCPNCGQSNQPDYNFCQKCGYVLAAASTPALDEAAAKPASRPAPPEPVPVPGQQAAPAPAAQPAAPAVVIIREDERKRRRVPGPVWAILGALLVIMACCGLMWFDVVDMPAGVVERLPAPLDDIIGQVVDAVEDRQVRLPVFGGPAEREPPEDGGQIGGEGEQPAGETCPTIIQATYSSQDDRSFMSSFYRGDGDGVANPSYGYFLPDHWSVKVIPCAGCQPLYPSCTWDDNNPYHWRCVVEFDEPDCDLRATAVFTPLGGNICAAQEVDMELHRDLATGCDGGDPCEEANINNAIQPGSITPAFTWANDNQELQMTLTNNVAFPSSEYFVVLEKGDSYEGTPCDVYSDQHQCYGVFYVWPDQFPSESGNYTMTIYEADPSKIEQCALATIIVTIPDPPPLPPQPPPAGVCSSGETYHEGWPYNNGCCTDGCWCQQGGEWGCWTTCADHCDD
ncbi:MAG: zinc ribbon domain-containing protein [Chloroflexota bacterium]